MYGISDIFVDSADAGKSAPSLSSELMMRELLGGQCVTAESSYRIALIAEKQTA